MAELTPTYERDVEELVRQFHVYGDFLDALPHGGGHINDTYCVRVNQAGSVVRYILQRINQDVFRKPEQVMENISRVLDHARNKLNGASGRDASRKVLTLVPARSGQVYHVDRQGDCWRCYFFIENARSHEVISSEAQAFEVAHAFGEFQRMLVDLPGDRLHETVPDFHNTPVRLAALRRAVAEDGKGRVGSSAPEIEFVESRAEECARVVEAMKTGAVPERVAHNDTKLNNVMIDLASGKAVCVIDLDTVMPGSVLYDFGDLVRTSTSPAAEDERDLAKVVMQLPMFKALVGGYLRGAQSFLTAAELELLAFSGKLITLEIGIRFLTDHLQGDVYFKTHRPNHNLDRCRTQFRLVQSIEEQYDAMQAAVREAHQTCGA